MNLLKKIRRDLKSDPNKSGIKKFFSKLLNISDKSEELKESSGEEESEENEDAVYMLGTLHKEIKVIKTLILDLTSIANDNPNNIIKEKLKLKINVFDEGLTGGWLVCEVMRKYTEGIAKIENETKIKVKKKLIVSIKAYSVEDDFTSSTGRKFSMMDKNLVSESEKLHYNESLNYWLTGYERSLDPLQNGHVIVPHFSKYLPNSKKQICLNDFVIEKSIGKGGFSRVFLVRK